MTHTTPNQIIIGLTGLAGTGKDTVRAILEAEHAAHGMAFADPMRTMLGAMFSASHVDTKYMLDRAYKEKPIPALGVSYRHLAQTLGTEWGRAQVHPDIWVRVAEQKIRYLNWQRIRPAAYCISDVRFDNEAAWVRHEGGVIWRVVREQAAAVRPHASEDGVEGIRPFLTLHNHGTIDELRDSVRDAFIETAQYINAQMNVPRKVIKITPRQPATGGAAA